jgi:hypothetical protein
MRDIRQKERPVFAVTAGGTKGGTSSFIDTSAYSNIQVMTSFVTGGTGSTTTCVYTNIGTAFWSGTDIPKAFLLGSARCDHSGGGTQVFATGSLCDQAMITHGTCSSASVLDISYVLYD